MFAGALAGLFFLYGLTTIGSGAVGDRDIGSVAPGPEALREGAGHA